MQRYILTDAGNILTRFKFRANLIKEIMAGFGVGNVDLAAIFKAKTDAISDEMYYHSLDIGQFNIKDLWQQLVKYHDISETLCSYPLFLSLWCRHLEPIEGVVNLYHSLQETFPLVVVSNGDAEGVRHITYHLMGTYGLKFLEIFISSERGRKKPELLDDVATFVRSKGVDPADCVFIDDLEAYVQAAKNLGISAIHFDGSKQPVEDLESALKKLGFFVTM